MISRRATMVVANAYQVCFTTTKRDGRFGTTWIELEADKLHDFLYANGFEASLIHAFGFQAPRGRVLKDFILGIHTGESLALVYPGWPLAKREAQGQVVLKSLAECLIRERQENSKFEVYGESRKNSVDAMQKALELEGYIYRHGTLWVPEESVIEEREEQDLLEGLIATVGLPDPVTLAHHLELAVSHYQESRWDDSISNSRKVLEGVLQQAAERHHRINSSDPLPPALVDVAGRVRDYLEKEGLIAKKEKEVIGHVYGLLSDTGGHPYIAQRDQARLMRHLALTFCQFILLKLECALGAADSHTE